MTNHSRPIMTTDDHERLQRLMTTLIGSRSPLADIVRRKVHAAAIVDPHQVSPDLVTSGRRVRFAINDGGSEEHTLTWANDRRSHLSTLSLQQPLGIALLGLRAGQSISLELSEQETSTLVVEDVLASLRIKTLRRTLYQPSLECLSRWEDDGGRPAAMGWPLAVNG